MSEVATKEITIAGLPFAVLQPYVAGHVATEAEARALNQVRAENIRNNMASKVKAASEGTQKEGEPTLENIEEFVAAYDAQYEFTIASVGGGRRTTDPVEVEALKIARDAFLAAIQAKGYTLKAVRESIGEDAYQAKIAEMALVESVVEEAKRRVEQRNAQAAAALGDLDLGGLSAEGNTDNSEE